MAEGGSALTGLWYIGIGLQLLSSFVGYTGKALLRLSELNSKKSPLKSKVLFRTGFITHFVCAPIVDISAYSFAPQSLIAPFGGFDVVWNAMFGPFLLKEKLTRGRALGSFLVMCGSITSGVFGNHHDPEYTVEYVESTLVNVRVLIYFSIFFCWFLFNRFVLIKRPEGSLMRGMALAWTGGSIAGNMWCVKIAIEIVQTSIAQNDAEPWKTWVPYVAILGAAFFGVTNAQYVTLALQHYQAFLVIPIIEGSMILSASISGAIVLLDVRGLPAWRILCYSLAVCVVICGMYVIFKEEASTHSSMFAGNASIGGDDGVVKQPSSPSAAKRANGASRPRSDTDQSIVSSRIRGISWEDVLNGDLELGSQNKSADLSVAADKDDICITLDAPPQRKAKTEPSATANGTTAAVWQPQLGAVDEEKTASKEQQSPMHAEVIVEGVPMVAQKDVEISSPLEATATADGLKMSPMCFTFCSCSAPDP